MEEEPIYPYELRCRVEQSISPEDAWRFVRLMATRMGVRTTADHQGKTVSYDPRAEWREDR